MRHRLPGSCCCLHKSRSFFGVWLRNSGRSKDYLTPAAEDPVSRLFSSSAFSWNAEWRAAFRNILKPSETESITAADITGRSNRDSNSFLKTSLSLQTTATEDKSGKSATFLLDIFGRAVRSKEAKQDLSNGHVSRQEFELSGDEGLSQVFRYLLKESNVDLALLLCNKLPANRLQTGIETLIIALLERVGNDDVNCSQKNVMAEKIIEVLGLMQVKGLTLSASTCLSLLKWILVCEDEPMVQKVMHLLQVQNPGLFEASNCSSSMTMSEAADSEVKARYLSENEVNEVEVDENDQCLALLVKAYRSWNSKDISNMLRKIDVKQVSCNTSLAAIFHCLGRLGQSTQSSDYLLHLQSTGKAEEELVELIGSYVEGFTQIRVKSRDIKRDVEGFKVVNRLLKLRTEVCFNAVISHCAEHGEIDLCIDLIQTMKTSGLELSATTYEPLIRLFARTLEISKAEDILEAMRSSGMQASTKAHKCLIFAHTKCGNIEKAYNLIEDISSKDLTPDMYTPIIFFYGMKKQLTQALGVFGQMRRRNVKPNIENFASLIRACAMKKNYLGAQRVFEFFRKQRELSSQDDTEVRAAMLRVYASCGSLRKVKQMVSCSADSLATTEAKSAVLAGLSARGKVEAAMEVYNSIRENGSWPDSSAFLNFMTAIGNAGWFDQLWTILECFKKWVETKWRGHKEELMSLAYSTVVHSLIHHNQLEKALDYLQHVQEENAGDVEILCLKVFTRDISDDKFPHTTVLTLEEKLKFLQGMRSRLNVRPTRMMYESLLDSCARGRDVPGADSVLEMMRSDNLQLNVFTYLILLRIAVSGGSVKMVEELFKQMKVAMENDELEDEHVILILKKILSFRNSPKHLRQAGLSKTGRILI